MDTPIATGKALARTVRALEDPEADVRVAGAMLLAMVTGERKEVRYAPMCVRSVISRALTNGYRDRVEMREAVVGLRRSSWMGAWPVTVAVIAVVGVVVPLVLSYWD